MMDNSTFRNLNVNFNDARSILENLVSEKIEVKCFSYYNQALSYTKKAPVLQTPDASLIEESFMVD